MIGIYLNLLDAQVDKDKFIELYNEYKNLLYWIALKRTNNIEDAEECVQETFFYVAKHFEKIGDVNSKSTKCYLSTIVTGFAINMYNDSQKFDIIPFDENEDLDYFESFDKMELLCAIDNVLEEKDRIFLYIKYIYKYKSSEIAELYNVNDSYVRKRIQYAKQKLRKYFNEENA